MACSGDSASLHSRAGLSMARLVANFDPGVPTATPFEGRWRRVTRATKANAAVEPSLTAAGRPFTDRGDHRLVISRVCWAAFQRPFGQPPLDGVRTRSNGHEVCDTVPRLVSSPFLGAQRRVDGNP
ncbi:hypothetical protein FA13DRAFT_1523575 [Coprinellus micaceus]|uniref:Uncharacterized protein n=1 Tax=Coprinellus micaceus TaxID=71717 RepID=A0A4Y7SJN5_COPMI|nr:hypothetical protein FA13DRAFT_1523575 [Coprinellus micaceus]